MLLPSTFNTIPTWFLPIPENTAPALGVVDLSIVPSFHRLLHCNRCAKRHQFFEVHLLSSLIDFLQVQAVCPISSCLVL